jgi:hypothetical protein
MNPYRFAPAKRFTIGCTLVWLAAATIAEESRMPGLKVSAERRTLETNDGQPFFWLGDTAWELFHRLDLNEVRRYLDDRAAKGVNVIQAVALAELDGLTVPNRQGHLPLVNSDPSIPDVRPGPSDDYWDFVDRVITEAETRGLYVGLLPTWGRYVTSHPFEGRVDGIFTEENAAQYGQFIGQRLANHSNIVWILGGDRAPASKEAIAIWRAMAQAIEQSIATSGVQHSPLMTYHTSGPGHASDYLHAEPWLDFTSAQSSHGNLVESWRFVERHWNTQPTKPMIDLESSYPGILIKAEWLPPTIRAAHPSTEPANDDHARRAAYWSVFAGACGFTYGHNSIWQMYTPDRKGLFEPNLTWEQALSVPSAVQMGYLRQLMERFPLTERIPDQSLFVPDAGKQAAHRRATRTHQWAMIYTPDGQTFSLRLGVLDGHQLHMQWFNPRSGEYLSTSMLSNAGQQTFDPPGEPGDGRDFVLILRTAN